MMNIGDALDFVYAYIKAKFGDEEEESGYRMATQADIDRLF